MIKNNNTEDIFIVNQIKDIINNSNNLSIAILVRNRTRVGDLIRLLKNNNLNINAIDIELLSAKLVIKDLLSLTKAILNLSDKTAWYSILRAPWCGLSLEELYYLNSFIDGSKYCSIYQVYIRY